MRTSSDPQTSSAPRSARSATGWGAAGWPVWGSAFGTIVAVGVADIVAVGSAGVATAGIGVAVSAVGCVSGFAEGLAVAASVGRPAGIVGRGWNAMAVPRAIGTRQIATAITTPTISGTIPVSRMCMMRSIILRGKDTLCQRVRLAWAHIDTRPSYVGRSNSAGAHRYNDWPGQVIVLIAFEHRPARAIRRIAIDQGIQPLVAGGSKPCEVGVILARIERVVGRARAERPRFARSQSVDAPGCAEVAQVRPELVHLGYRAGSRTDRPRTGQK